MTGLTQVMKMIFEVIVLQITNHLAHYFIIGIPNRKQKVTIILHHKLQLSTKFLHAMIVHILELVEYA